MRRERLYGRNDRFGRHPRSARRHRPRRARSRRYRRGPRVLRSALRVRSPGALGVRRVPRYGRAVPALGENEGSVHGDDGRRHVGLVVDDPSVVEGRLEDLGVDRLSTSGLDVTTGGAIVSGSSATERSSSRNRIASSVEWASRGSGDPTPSSRSPPRRGWRPTEPTPWNGAFTLPRR